MEAYIKAENNPRAKLKAAVQIHLYLSEAMQPWFYFAYMESKNLSKKEQKMAIAGELYTEKIFADILNQGQARGDFILCNPQLTAGVIKAMLQDWYLKRWKYAKRKISVDQYAAFVFEFLMASISSRIDDKSYLQFGDVKDVNSAYR